MQTQGMKRKSWVSRTAACIGLTLALVATSQTVATADETDESVEVAETIDDVNVTGDDAEVVADSAARSVELPDDSDGDATIYVDGDLLELAPPIETSGDTTVIDDTTVVESADASVGYAVQAIEDETGLEGVRQLVVINDADAPSEYRFDVDLPEGATLISATDLFGSDFDTGEIFIIDSEGGLLSIVDPAWAKDANNDDVATSYRVDGDTIVQTVDFDEDTAFPVVADPSWWKIAKCAGAIAFVLGSTFFSIAKILKFKKLVKSLGGVRKAAKLFAGAGTVTEALAGIGAASKDIALELLGVTAIKEACF